MNQSFDPLHMTVYSALFGALITAGAFLAIPLGPVPIVLQNFFVMLTGLLMGSRWGFFSVGVYLLAGACGLPVFAGATGGLGRLFGPTGGYLFGYLPAVWVVGSLSERFGRKTGGDLLALVCGTILVYACGVSWLRGGNGHGLDPGVDRGHGPFFARGCIEDCRGHSRGADPEAHNESPGDRGRGGGVMGFGMRDMRWGHPCGCP